jgi:glucose-6-phosphate isomerase/transaldolase/glucose-6-phosphate isomerase
MHLNLGIYVSDAKTAVADLERRDVVRRIWQKDHSVWKPDPSEIANRLGWLTVTDLMWEQVPALESFAREVRDAGFRHVVLLGMGGSSLGPEVLRAAFGTVSGYPELIVLDSTIPGCVQSVAQVIDPARALFLVSSKSGTTIETLSLFSYFHAVAVSAIGRGKAGQNFVAITDPGTPLARLAEEARFRRLFLNPPDIGGRYSVLSYFGLVPAALMGINITRLLDRADSMRDRCMANIAIDENPGALLGAAAGTLALRGRDKLTLVTSPAINSFGLWLEQLVAESTGKQGKGIIPVVGEPMVEPADYGDDRLFAYLRLRDEQESAMDRAIKHIESSGQPVVLLELCDVYDLGGEFFRWEFATAVAGALVGIHPFNQPNVQAAKLATEQALQQFLTSGHLPEAEGTCSPASLLAGAGEGNYLAALAYVRQTAGLDDLLADFRRKVLKRYHIATTSGYGPRYLHSTGQLHKGGPGTGLFLVIGSTSSEDLPIPGQSYSFGTLADAQAAGDTQALRLSGRPIARMRFDYNDVPGLSRSLGELA